MIADAERAWFYDIYLQNIYKSLFPNASVDPELAAFDLTIEATGPYHAGFRCQTCWVFNRTESTYCSACDVMLPKSAVLILPDVDSSRPVADHAYNHALGLLNEGEIAAAEKLLTEAYEHYEHPDYAFYAGYCRLLLVDPAGALVRFEQAASHQFAGVVPFWPLPLRPAEMKNVVARLRTVGENTNEIVEGLNQAMSTHFTLREKR
jgi:hypothetical protein